MDSNESELGEIQTKSLEEWVCVQWNKEDANS